MENVKVTLVKSLIAQKQNKVLTAQSLGLKRPGDSVTLKNDATLAGKIKVLSHLVKVKTV
jgi:large subunit ribosomal protein L30